MYLHRLVIDANCVNAKGLLPAMTALELYHAIGAVEIIVTSTLPAELDRTSSQAQKIAQYQSVGGNTVFFLDSHAAQSMPGATVRESLLHVLRRGLFGESITGHTLDRALRDCLHLDQAQMNAVDVFITNDKRLHKAEAILKSHGADLLILPPEGALEHINKKLIEAIGSTKPEAIRDHCKHLGPIIIGSNSFTNCEFLSPQTSERLASLTIENGFLKIAITARDYLGDILARTNPGNRPTFVKGDVKISQVGRGPLLVSESPSSSIVIADGQQVFLAIRTTHTGRVVVYQMSLRDASGHIVATVHGESLTLSGASMMF